MKIQNTEQSRQTPLVSSHFNLATCCTPSNKVVSLVVQPNANATNA